MSSLDASMDGCRRLFCGPVVSDLRKRAFIRSVGSSPAIEGNGLDLSVITGMADGRQVDGPSDMVVEAGNGHLDVILTTKVG